MTQNTIIPVLSAIKKDNNFDEITIHLEKKAANGIRLMAYGYVNGEKHSVRIDRAKVFYEFAKQYSCEKEWNVLTIKLDTSDAFTVIPSLE